MLFRDGDGPCVYRHDSSSACDLRVLARGTDKVLVRNWLRAGLGSARGWAAGWTQAGSPQPCSGGLQLRGWTPPPGPPPALRAN